MFSLTNNTTSSPLSDTIGNSTTGSSSDGLTVNSSGHGNSSSSALFDADGAFLSNASNTGSPSVEETTEYYYNYDESVNYIDPAELVPNALGYGVTLVLGLVGNVLVIVSVARFKRMQNVTNIFLLSLATADLLLCLVCIPVKFTRFFSFTWTFGLFLCKCVHYLQNVSIVCSVMNLAGLSLERYYAILHPMRAKYMCTVTLAKRTVLVIWVLSLVMALPILVGQEHMEVGVVRKAYWCIENWDTSMYHQMYQLYMMVLVLALPLTLMTFAYCSICRKLWLVRYHRANIRAHKVRFTCQERVLLSSHGGANNHRHSNIMPGGFIVRRKKIMVDEDATRKQVIKMLVAVVVLFAACWGPIMVNNTLVAFGILHKLHLGYLKPMRQVFWLMAYFNSCVNPIVYGFMSKNFRDTFRYTFWLCCRRKRLRRPPRLHGRSSFQLPSANSLSVRATCTSLNTDDRVQISRMSGGRFRLPSPPGRLSDGVNGSRGRGGCRGRNERVEDEENGVWRRTLYPDCVIVTGAPRDRGRQRREGGEDEREESWRQVIYPDQILVTDDLRDRGRVGSGVCERERRESWRSVLYPHHVILTGDQRNPRREDQGDSEAEDESEAAWSKVMYSDRVVVTPPSPRM